MTISNTTTRILPTICLLAVACNKEPAQEVAEARKDRAVKHDKLANEQADLDAKQAESRAELARKQSMQQSELLESKVKSEAKGDEKVAIAQAEVGEERRVYHGKMGKRIQDAEARATEFQTLSKRLPAKKREKFDIAWKVYAERRDAAVKQNQLLQSASNADWVRAKPETEQCIDRLEASVADVEQTI